MLKIIKIYCYISAFLPIESFLVPVIVLFYVDYLGFDFEQYTNYLSLLTLAIFITEIPMGYIADRIGNRISIVLGQLIYALGFSCFFFLDFNNYYHLFIIVFIISMGQSLNSGNLGSIAYKVFSIYGEKSNFKSFLVRLNTLGVGTAALFSLAGGFLYEISKYLPMVADILVLLIRALLAFVLLIIFWPTSKENIDTPRKKQHLLLKEVMFSFKKINFFVALFFSAMLFTLLRVSLNFYQPILQENHWGGRELGFLFSISILVTSLLSYLYSTFFEKYLNYTKTIYISIILILFSLVFFYQDTKISFYFISGFILHQILRTVAMPIFSAEQHKSIEDFSDYRTTIISFSLLTSALTVSLGLYLSGKILSVIENLQNTLVFVHIIVLLFIITVFYIFKNNREVFNQ